VRESNEDRDMSLVDDTAAVLWGREGREATSDDPVPVEAIVGLE
jgi:hypothetical protein